MRYHYVSIIAFFGGCPLHGPLFVNFTMASPAFPAPGTMQGIQNNTGFKVEWKDDRLVVNRNRTDRWKLIDGTPAW